MKNAINPLKAVFAMIIAFSCLHTSAQDVWSIHGNNADSAYFIGTINSEPFRIKTDSIDRIIVGTNDTVKFKGLFNLRQHQSFYICPNLF